MYGQNNMYNQHNMNNQYSNNNYNQSNNNLVVKQKNGFFGTFILLFLLVVAVVALLQVTDVIDVVSVFEEKILNKSSNNEEKTPTEENKEKEPEKSEEELMTERLSGYCSTYGSEITATKIYVNGRFVTSEDNFDTSEIIDEHGFPKPGEFCGISDDQLTCMHTTEEKVYYTYNCVTNIMNVSSYDEFRSNLINHTMCSLVDNEGNYTDTTETGGTCSGFVCKVTLNGKEFSKNCIGEE